MSRKKQRDEDTWAPIQESLDVFQPAPLAARLREYLAPRVPPGTRRLDEPTRRTLFEGVDALLAEHAGAWYTQAGARLGDESLGGYDPRGLFGGQDGAPGMGVESNIEPILSALGVAHAWLCTLDTYFRSLALPEDAADRVTVLSDAVRRVIALTAEATGGRGRWYDCVHRALGWLVESLGIRRTERLERALGEALEDFTSGSLPSDAQTRQAASLIARAVVREDFPRRQPEEDVS